MQAPIPTEPLNSEDFSVSGLIKASGCEGSRIYSTMLSEQWRIGPANERIGPNHHGSAVDVMQ
ncbi:hypothetical protein ANCCAN_14088 [Ancylostoma caninum]|uniref:Uncharacterized protein n=1 Tax=Ancylostoma caninum TaxID=29170 RepID=A0A368G6D1_ANCCA|nr:hypothetical protein ANCCAN_14088 [Ancylostoma caninum]